jgi:hypothetical protein
LIFALLEGALRRKSGGLLDVDGIVLQPFTIQDTHGNPRNYTPPSRLNRVGHALAMFEQVVTANRRRACAGWTAMMNEVTSLHPDYPDAYEFVDESRNDLLHGAEYWSDRGSIFMNMLSLLVIDEIDPVAYANVKSEVVDSAAFWESAPASDEVAWRIYPPDI